MVFRQVIVMMLNHLPVMIGLPDSQADNQRYQSQQAQSHKGSGQSPVRAYPAGQRVSNQPAGMGQSELRSEKCRSILCA